MMKKIGLMIIILMVVYLSSFSINKCFAVDDICEITPTPECCCDETHKSQSYCINFISSCTLGDQQQLGGGDTNNNSGGCDPSKVYRITKTLTGCCPGVVDENGNCDTSLENLGITMNTECLLNGQCSLNVYKVMGIRKSNEKPTVLGFFQDIVLAATTFVGTVVVIALIVSGLIFAFGSITGKDTKKAKTIMIDCLVGLLLVMGSYTIIRLIQFIATAGS